MSTDSVTMLGRELKHTLRFPTMFISSIGTPVIMLLLFVYVFGNTLGAGLGGGGDSMSYVDYLVPGILMMTIAAGSATTAVNVNTDMREGIIDRFRTMPISTNSVLTGHVVASLLRTFVTTALVTGVALLVGFRPSAGPAGWLGAAGVVAAFALAMAWLGTAFGIVAKTPAGANSLTLPIQLILPFLSSTFVPPESMPAGVRWFAEYQPLTPIVESMRGLLSGGTLSGGSLDAVPVALGWCVGITLLAYVWARRAFRRG